MNKLFIHIPKNGGMTIRLSPDLKNTVSPVIAANHLTIDYRYAATQAMMKTGDHLGLEHARYRDIMPFVFHVLRPFAIIRNPWDRVVSRYFFAKKVIEVEKKVNKDYADVRSFDHFLAERDKWIDKPYTWHRAVRCWHPNFEHVCDSTGQFSLKNIDILRFENYSEDVQRYFGLTIPLQARNVTGLNKAGYREIYNNKSIQQVAEWYKQDIDTWGYDFDTGPTRNTTYD